ncbi:organomercurial lyase [Microbacterium sp. BK668]|uniref:organomercurial lyase n=1 Tax=Microbacterium sp. BK668 TaxID=2512118 RepID=UPI00105F90C7|nr:organomercurial lyase [Microbacterium sp. BK668]TDN87748.1 alkylmercury lyase-like protein [Microbacterium sp. BK668]
MSERDEAVRLAIYHGFAESGAAPSRTQLAESLDLTHEEVDAAIRALAAARHLALGAGGAIVLAHPFATRNFGFSVMGENVMWWGGCAWDSFAIPNLVTAEPSVLVATTCPGCGSPHAWTVTNQGPPEGDQVAHFLTDVHHIWDDVIHACDNQRIFCSHYCVDRWLEATGNVKGAVFDLATLWRLAAHWYDGRLDSPYRRREPDEASAYFASVGLTGPFWGN